MILPIQYSRGLTYQIYVPQGIEAAYLEQMCEIKGSPDFKFERMLPTLTTEILINFNDKMLGKFGDHYAGFDKGEFIIQGSQFRFFDSYLPKSPHFLSIKLTNKGFKELINISSSAIVNTHIHNPVNSGFREVQVRMVEAHTFEQRVQLLLQWLRPKISREEKDYLSIYVEQKLKAYPYYSSKDLEKMTGFSSKYINRRFKEYSGHTISNFKRLCRFKHTLGRIRNFNAESWTSILYDHNYYDQSHFIKEVNFFTGVNPTQLRQGLSGQHYNLIL